MKRLFVLYFLSCLLILTFAKANTPELKEIPASLIIHVPAKNTKLERRKFKSKLYNFMPSAPTTYASVVAQNSLPLLFQKAPSVFPKGTRLTRSPDIKVDVMKNSVMQVSLSKQFLQRGFWKNKRQALLAVYAIVNTAAEGNPMPMNPLRVRLLINGKPFRNLANIDVRKPLLPRLDLVAKNKTLRVLLH